MTLVRAAMVDAWDRASPRERALVAIAATLVTLALLYAIAWQPIARDIARTRDALARDRAALAVVRGYVEAPIASAAPASAGTGDARAAVVRALAARGIAGAQVEPRDGRVGSARGCRTPGSCVARCSRPRARST
jgi:type II secretory pathway component PulM